MKIQFTQSFAIDDQEFRIKKKGKAEEAHVPLYFVFLSYFVALFKDEKIKILEVSEEEFSALGQDEVMKARFEKVEPDVAIMAAVEHVMIENKEEEKDEDETDSDSSTVSDSGSQSQAGSEEQAPTDSNVESGEVIHNDKKPVEEVSNEVKALQAEYDLLHEKAKRLNKKEKERYEILKTQLKIEG